MAEYLLHDPDAGPIDYSVDFTNWLADGDSVSSVTWSIFPTGPTLGSKTLVVALATQDVSGGTLGATYRLTASVTSTNGIVDDRSIVLRVGQQ